jgi:hypothetical protein
LPTTCVQPTISSSNLSEQLETESGVAFEAPAVTRVRQLIAAGRWAAAEPLLSQLGALGPNDLTEIRFLFFRQKYLELIEARELGSALTCLREQLGALKRHPEQLRELSSKLFQAPPAAEVGSPAAETHRGTARTVLLDRIQTHVQPSTMMPAKRLRNLFGAVLWDIYRSKEWRGLFERMQLARTPAGFQASHTA